MEKEDRNIFIRDLCCRIPYGVLVKYKPMSFIKGKDSEWVDIPLCSVDVVQNTFSVGDRFSETIDARLFNRFGNPFIKPYLRPLSSMTEEEKREFQKVYIESIDIDNVSSSCLCADWFYRKHFDVRGFIEKGWALKATIEFYKEYERQNQIS